jgi:hypothetical protein
MGKESIFLSCLGILIVFEVGYYLLNPTSVWALSISAISSIIVIAISTGLLMSLNIAASGEGNFGARLGFISASLFCILFQFNIPVAIANSASSFWSGFWTLNVPGIQPPTTGTNSIPIGIGLVYPNLTNIFITGNNDIASMFGLIIISIIIFITIISGVMIAAGDHG